MKWTNSISKRSLQIRDSVENRFAGLILKQSKLKLIKCDQGFKQHLRRDDQEHGVESPVLSICN